LEYRTLYSEFHACSKKEESLPAVKGKNGCGKKEDIIVCSVEDEMIHAVKRKNHYLQ